MLGGLMMEDQRLIGPWDLLVRIQETPLVVARPLPALVVPDVAGRVPLVQERRVGERRALAPREVVREALSLVGRLAGRVVLQLAAGLPPSKGLTPRRERGFQESCLADSTDKIGQGPPVSTCLSPELRRAIRFRPQRESPAAADLPEWLRVLGADAHRITRARSRRRHLVEVDIPQGCDLRKNHMVKMSRTDYTVGQSRLDEKLKVFDLVRGEAARSLLIHIIPPRQIKKRKGTLEAPQSWRPSNLSVIILGLNRTIIKSCDSATALIRKMTFYERSDQNCSGRMIEAH